MRYVDKGRSVAEIGMIDNSVSYLNRLCVVTT